MLDIKMKEWIDNASYYSLLYRWRFAKGEEADIFQDEIGEYYSRVMSEKKNALSHEEQVQISKDIGW